ncbi:RNA 2',3'-cyclic phosphodiesterase [Ferrimonas balearica]|uniref:RNA 2',3'-cyclic phosphodiesterase n=1 Tax=Ferrimonas balearica TaxID=44012 RepID=UPI001C993D2C|nr:RNA 2',3'-cyclic phosphodiesterase [Ferrimonas balearica]MBY5993649.1 RNA 2',3'-cyclic phosphodiesterase [Ferrimonas balearica]
MAERMFFSVPLDRITQLELIRLQAQLGVTLGGRARVVPAANFHLTLAFLGPVTQGQRLALLQRWQALSVPEVSLTLDGLAYWPRSGVVCLTAKQTPIALAELANALRQDASGHQLHQSQRGFRPHVSLFRGVERLEGDLPEIAPISFSVREVDLMVSVFEGKGVSYQSVKRWGPHLSSVT